MQELLKSEVLGLARQFEVLLVEVLDVTLLEFAWHVSLSPLGEDLPPPASAHLLNHLEPLRLGVVDLGGEEGSSLRLFDDLDPENPSCPHLGWLLHRAGLGVAAGVNEFHGFLPWRLLLLLFLRLLHGSVFVDLGCLPPEEVYDLVVGLGNHLGGPGSTPLITGGDVLLSRGLNQGGQVPGSEVGELDRKLGVLQDAVSEDLLVPKSDVGVALEHLGVLPNVRTACDFTAGPDVLKVEEATVLVALVSKSKVNTGAVLGGGPHEVGHNTRNVEGQLPLRLLRHLCEPDLLVLLGLRSTTRVDLLGPVLSRPTQKLRNLYLAPSFRLELGLPPRL